MGMPAMAGGILGELAEARRDTAAARGVLIASDLPGVP